MFMCVRREVTQQNAGLSVNDEIFHVVGDNLIHALRGEDDAAVYRYASAHEAGSRAAHGHGYFVRVAKAHYRGDLFCALREAHRLRHIFAVDGHFVVRVLLLHLLAVLKALPADDFPQFIGKLRRKFVIICHSFLLL